MDPRMERLKRYRYPEEEEDNPQRETAPQRRKITAFEAVAGKAGYESHLPRETRNATKYRDTQTNSNLAVPPEEVLFRRQGAPERYEENDIYFSSEPKAPLPDSDLLKFLHSYTSHFYKRTTPDGGKLDFKSMDETALLALGILLEETAGLKLGETGDFAFAEGQDEDETTGKRKYWNGKKWVRSVIEKRPGTQEAWTRDPATDR